jgi:hypothetical protein
MDTDLTPTRRQTRHAMQLAITRAMLAHDCNTTAAAASMGCTPDTFYQRARRAGVNLTALKYAPPEPVHVPTGVVALTETHVTLTLTDYALLQARAAEGLASQQVYARLETAESIIASLTRSLQSALRALEGAPPEPAPTLAAPRWSRSAAPLRRG